MKVLIYQNLSSMQKFNMEKTEEIQLSWVLQTTPVETTKIKESASCAQIGENQYSNVTK